jgi:serine/threonine-protein kinase
MGEVYLAQDTKLDRRVALKILPGDVAGDRNRMSRFVQEAKAASGLNHPNIITIYEIEQIDSVNFIATEFIDGETLRERMRKTSPMRLGEVLDLGAQIASALSAAHAAGIVHRDIKPENLMLRGDGIVKVLDFGLAKLTERVPPESVDTEAPTSFKTEPGTVVGTATYMSPEQARGLDIDGRTDIFSLGVVLYELAAGCLPFAGSTCSEVVASLLSEKEPQPLARYAREVPAELERIVSKALRKEREQRYQTTKDLLLDLQSLKQQMEFEAKLERSMPPETRGGQARVSEAFSTLSGEAITTTPITESLVTGIIHRRSTFIIALAVLIVSAAGLAYFFYSAPPANAIDSIAVLPLVNASNDPNTEYLSDGITESIISNLSQLSELKVVARSTVFRYKGKDVDPRKVGHDLGVRAVLMGRLIQQDDNLTIRTELVNVSDGTQLWGQQYNRKLADVFAVQEEIAREISEKLRLKLTSTEQKQLAKRPTGNLKAFQYYMQGRAYNQRRTREDMLAAIHYYERALEEDRNYALAYAGLADAYLNLGLRGYIAPMEGRRKAEEAARSALALDENLAEAYAALGHLRNVFAPANFSLGDRDLRRAIGLSPSLAMARSYLGFSFLMQGRLDEALAEAMKARELDPLSSIIAREVALCIYLKRDYGRALELLRQANELGPTLSTQWEIGMYIQNGSYNEALAELEEARRERGNDPILILSSGMVFAAQGKAGEALQIIKELEEMSGPSLDQAHWIAKIYAAMNEKEMALNWLERGLAAGTIGGFYNDEPVWDPIRNEPRFADLLRRMGVSQ